jgi:capsid protein
LPVIRPTIADRVVTYFDPVRGAERYRARLILALAGGYEGGRKDRRATTSWLTSSGSADADLLPDLTVLRDRSRDLTRNAPLAAGAIATVVTNVVGTGLEPQSQIDRDLLGLDDAAADEWQRAAEREWWLWASSPDCDVSRTQDFCALQDLVFRAVLESGDCFVVKRYIERPGNPYGLAFQVIEADRVANPDFKQDGSDMGGGRTVSAASKPTATARPWRNTCSRSTPATSRRRKPFGGACRFSARRPASGSCGTCARRLRPNQSRGVPYLAAVIEPFN